MNLALNSTKHREPQTDPALFQELSRLFTSQRFFVGSRIPERFRNAMIAYSQAPLALVCPRTSSEVQHVVRCAQQYQVPLYPVSTGRNWGYGSALAPTPGCIVLDLSLMKQIECIDDRLGIITIEPGVTQGDLYKFIERTKLPFRMDPSGGGPHTGVMGNILERGVGGSRYGDHLQSVSGMEVVLASGELLRTGFGHFENSQVPHHHRWGLGPYLEGLFTQSNLGIVTKLGLWLEPIPEQFCACYVQCSAEHCSTLLERLGDLMLQEIIPGSFVLGNAQRLLAARMQFPWDTAANRNTLSTPELHHLALNNGLGAWNGMLALYGSKGQVRDAQRLLRSAVRGIASKLIFLSEGRLQLLERAQACCARLKLPLLRSSLAPVRLSFDILRGIPTEASLFTPYWRNRENSPPKADIDPLADGCGLIWCVPTLPLRKEHIETLLTVAAPVHARYQFAFCPGFLAPSRRSLICSLPILFNRNDEHEVARARACYQELSANLLAAGYPPYRLPVDAMQLCYDQSDSFWATITSLKRALDPQQLLAPGRYCIP